MRHRLLALVAITLLVAACTTKTSNGDDGGGDVGSIDTPGPHSAEPTPGPIATTFSPISLAGHGSKVVKFKIPEGAAAIATLSEQGSSNFIVESLGADGRTNDVLVNEIGSFKGTVLFDADFGTHSIAFKVQSNGSWTILVRPVSAASKWDPSKAISGTGDAVLQLVPPASGLTIITARHRGTANFVVIAYGPDGSDLLINEIGHYSGQTTIADGSALLSVEANGAWSFTPG